MGKRLNVKTNLLKKSRKNTIPRPRQIICTVMIKDESSVALAATSALGILEITQIAVNVRSTNISGLLNTIALNYSMWRLSRLRVYFTTIQPTTTSGLLAIGFSPDPYYTPTTMPEILQLQGSKSMKPYSDTTIDIPRSNWFYVNLQNSEQRLSDYGSIIFGSSLFSSAITPGILRFEGIFSMKQPSAS
jgi:hypothetical protein